MLEKQGAARRQQDPRQHQHGKDEQSQSNIITEITPKRIFNEAMSLALATGTAGGRGLVLNLVA